MRGDLLLDALFASEMPAGVTEVLRLIAQAIQKKFGPASAPALLSDYLFLRFVFPSLSSSEYHTPSCSAPSPSPSFPHRLLSLISSTLQCAIIDQEVGAEGDRMEGWRKQARGRLYAYLDDLQTSAVVKEGEIPSKKALDKAVNSHAFVCHRLKKRTCVPAHTTLTATSSRSIGFFGRYFAKYSVRIKERIRSEDGGEEERKRDLAMLKRLKTHFPRKAHTGDLS